MTTPSPRLVCERCGAAYSLARSRSDDAPSRSPTSDDARSRFVFGLSGGFADGALELATGLLGTTAPRHDGA